MGRGHHHGRWAGGSRIADRLGSVDGRRGAVELGEWSLIGLLVVEVDNSFALDFISPAAAEERLGFLLWFLRGISL